MRSTGRRLAYARHLTSGQHPLTGRVLVNRIWMHQSEIFAERVVKDAGNDVSAQVRRAWRLALVSEPTPEQMARSVESLDVQTESAAQRIAELTLEETKKVRFSEQPETRAAALRVDLDRVGSTR